MINPQKTKHPLSAKKERQAVNIAERIFESHVLISPHFTRDDKRNDIDGYFVVLNEDRTEYGRFDVQIKSLYKPHSLSLSIEFLNYCKDSITPVILIAVDKKQRKLFWLHLNRDYIETELKFKKNRAKKTIHLKEEQSFVEGQGIDDATITQWKNVITELREKISSYDEVKQQREKYKILYEQIVAKSNPLLGQKRNEFVNIHKFLDELNSLIDGKFNIIKRQLFPNTWKIGLGYWNYTNTRISYVLYAIPSNNNDIQIQQIKVPIYNLLRQGFTVHNEGHTNPLEQHPEEHAQYFIKKYITSILDNRYLEHGVNEFLAMEFIFASIDKFYIPLGLPIKDEYAVMELESAFWDYLPWWTVIAINILESRPSFRPKNYRQEPVDPNSLVSWVKHDLCEIDKTVKAKLTARDEIRPFIAIENKKLPFRILHELLLYLKVKNIRKIKRVYSTKDTSRLSKGSACWNLLSPDAFEENLRFFFANFPEVYASIISKNFPQLKNDLDYFKDTSKVIVLFKAKDRYDNFGDSPMIEILRLYSKHAERERTIAVYNKDEKPEFNDLWKNKSIEINGKHYIIEKLSCYHNGIVYEDIPLMNFVYESLHNRLNQYF